jgi:DNA polymerase V
LLPIFKQTSISERKLCGFLRHHIIDTTLDLTRMPDRWVRSAMNITGLRTVWELRGTPCLTITNCADKRKGILSSRSFGTPVYSLSDLKEAVVTFVARAAEKHRAQESAASNLTVTLVTGKHDEPGIPNKFGKSVHLLYPTAHTPLLIKMGGICVDELYQKRRKYKKAWVMLTGIIPQSEIQGDLFSDSLYTRKVHRLMESLDKINAIYGQRTLIPASNGIDQSWKI